MQTLLETPFGKLQLNPVYKEVLESVLATGRQRYSLKPLGKEEQELGYLADPVTDPNGWLIGSAVDARAWLGDRGIPRNSMQDPHLPLFDVDAGDPGMLLMFLFEPPNALAMPAHTIVLPSSQRGHWHVYINQPVEWRDYKEMLGGAATVGLIDWDWAAASIRQECPVLRLPGYRKVEPSA